VLGAGLARFVGRLSPPFRYPSAVGQDKGSSELKRRQGLSQRDVSSLDTRLRELSAEVERLEAARAVLVAGRGTHSRQAPSGSVKARTRPATTRSGSVKARSSSVKPRASSGKTRGSREVRSGSPEGMTSTDFAEEKINRRVVLAESSEMAAYLQKHLGQKLTAYLAGLKDVKTVGQWAKGRVEPPALTRERLRAASHAAELFNVRYNDKAAQGWFFGANSSLDDRAPAAVLREAQTPDELATIVPLARAFVRGAH